MKERRRGRGSSSHIVRELNTRRETCHDSQQNGAAVRQQKLCWHTSIATIGRKAGRGGGGFEPVTHLFLVHTFHILTGFGFLFGVILTGGVPPLI